ncbi:MAG: DUF1911 domain-containing protein [Pseudomonadaceae bacterium]|nr:DUF1911 domain-containing protein [Pseudomonadaceae bacterium]
MNRRQQFLTAAHYAFLSSYCDEEEGYWQFHPMQAESPEQEASLKARHIQSAFLSKLILLYTAGEPIDSMVPVLEKLIGKYELSQKALGYYEQSANISPLAIDDWLYQYEECVQVISLCVLLHRIDLLKRFVALLDAAGFAGTDTLYEDLLSHHLPDRQDVDGWYHAVYNHLIRAIYAATKDEASALLKQYCDEWYLAFEQAPWHNSHLDGDEGSYEGYWAFEAAAIAFLYGIDDSKIDHMVYPKDLVAYARGFTPAPESAQIARIEAGQPCTHTGYWFTPAQANSRRHFKQGESMPSVSDSSWGDALWYWAGEEKQ